MPTTTDTQQYTPYGLPPSAVNYMAYIDNAYSADDSETQKLKELLVTHSLQVARKALEIAHTHALPLADGDIVAAAMLHDIGIIATNAPGIHCHGTEHYLRHGVLGAAMLREAGAPEWPKGTPAPVSQPKTLPNITFPCLRATICRRHCSNASYAMPTSFTAKAIRKSKRLRHRRELPSLVSERIMPRDLTTSQPYSDNLTIAIKQL